MLSGSKKAFTFIEVLSTITILILMISVVYGLVFHGFMSNERGVKNIDAIQEMSFVLHSIRTDLQNLIEFNDDASTYIKYDQAEKKLKFTVVSGVNNDGLLVFSDVSYVFEGGYLVKHFCAMGRAGALGSRETKQIVKKDIFREYGFEICDELGRAVSETPAIRAKNPPRMIRSKLVHATNTNLELNLSLFSYYMRSNRDREKYWLPCYKILPIEPRFNAVTSKGEVDIDIISNPAVKMTPHGIKVGGGM